jgi:hypothetical protein
MVRDPTVAGPDASALELARTMAEKRARAHRGEGVQYIGLEVTDLDAMVEELRMKGVRLTTEKPVEYPNGSRWAFIHPKAMHGVLLALIEKPV